MGLVLVTPPALEPLTVAEVEAHLRLGSSNTEPSPDAPSVALASAGAGNVDNGAHRYRLTFVTADGETDGGTISDAVTVADKTANGKVTVSNIPLGGSQVTARKLYRTAAAGSTYFLVATISDNTTTSYTDNIADASLGVAVPSSNTTGDPYLRSLITAARQHVEEFLRRSLITSTWRYTLDGFPCSDVLELPRANLLGVSAVEYIDPAGDTQTLSTDVYSVDTASLPGRICLKYVQVWPFVQVIRNAVTITFTAGYGPAASDVPQPIKAAMKLLIGHWHENREAVNVGQSVTTLPLAAESLLWQYRNLEAA